MKTVRIVKSWSSPDIMRQTPGSSGTWGDYHFSLDSVDRCDHLVVLNHFPNDIAVEVPRENVWCLVQEPPVRGYEWIEKGFKNFGHVITQNPSLRGAKFIHSHGALPWHVNRSYDELKASLFPQKTKNLSWITSNLAVHSGHRQRLDFLERLRKSALDFDLYGRGFSPLVDKWDGLAPYRYSIAVENHSQADYWTEKVADCFLAGAMPIYFGATNLSKYFPEKSFVWLDINAPDAARHVAQIVKSDLAEKNRDALEEARRRVLEVHQFFPRLVQLIQENSLPGRQPTFTRRTFKKNPDHTEYFLNTSRRQRIFNSLKRRLGLSK